MRAIRVGKRVSDKPLMTGLAYSSQLRYANQRTTTRTGIQNAKSMTSAARLAGRWASKEVLPASVSVSLSPVECDVDERRR